MYGEALYSCFEVIVKGKYALQVDDLGKQNRKPFTALYNHKSSL
jgi:hypothetical protein